jgi:hypothetical protein
MLKVLVNVLEQMDLALDQLAVNDVNYKRFTLMLVDNVVELTLHQSRTILLVLVTSSRAAWFIFETG